MDSKRWVKAWIDWLHAPEFAPVKGSLGRILPDGRYLVVGQDRQGIREAKEAIVTAFGWGLGVTLLLAAVGGALASAGFLRRVDAINRTTRGIIQGNLADRVPTRGTGDELDRLAANLNEMLDRTQSLMGALRRVSSDIAHDLRTPLTRLRQRLDEPARAGMREPQHLLATADLGEPAAEIFIRRVAPGHVEPSVLAVVVAVPQGEDP